MPDDTRPLRADARRNYERILAQAARDFTDHGVDTSLDDIARRAGVGSATLFRHFPSRDALLTEVIHDGLEAVCAEARRLESAPDPDGALEQWMTVAVEHAATYRGLSTSLMAGFHDPGSRLHASCEAVHAAGGRLLARAQQHGTARPELTWDDLLTLGNALAWCAEQPGADRAGAVRFVRTMFHGVLTR